MKKFKYVLTLPHGEVVDSQILFEHRDITLLSPYDKGVYDTYEEAEKAAEARHIWNYLILITAITMDSYENSDGSVKDGLPDGCYLTVEEAEEAAAKYLGIGSDWSVLKPTFKVSKHQKEDGKVDGYYYELYVRGECCYTSLCLDAIYKTKKRALKEAERHAENFEAVGLSIVDIVKKEILEVEVEE